MVSPDMRQRARWLQQVLVSRGIRVEHWAVPDAWDIEQLQFRILELLEQETRTVAEGNLTLNATGGTKPMSIAAFEAFRAYDLPICYVHPERDRLIWLHPSQRPNRNLANRLRIDLLLQARGSRIESAETSAVPAPLRELTDWLVANTATYTNALSTLNWLAHGAERDLISPPMEGRQLADQPLQYLLDRLAGAGLLQVRGKRLRFSDEDARFYVNGGWLEEHVYAVLRRLRRELPQIQDLARSIDIVRETHRGDSIPNEIDVACLAENRLYIIECKTRTWGDGSAHAPGANAIYRLDTLSELLGGLQARAMLISYRDLPPETLRRAADLHIRICAGRRLPELAAVLRDWIDVGSYQTKPLAVSR